MYADDSQLYSILKSYSCVDQEASIEQLQQCICEISDWMNRNDLKLNDDKTEFVIVGTAKQRAKMLFDSIRVGDVDIKSSPCVRNLGVLIDAELTMKNQVNAICKSCYHHIRNIRLIRPYLSISAAKTIVHSVISSRLDYCNAVLIGISEHLIKKLQRVQNSAARLVLNLNRYDSISTALISLHWLPVKERIAYKINVMVFKALTGESPGYIVDMLELSDPPRNLRSSLKKNTLKEKKSKLVTMGDRAFSIAAPKFWNSLPDDIRNIEQSIDVFKQKLKTFLFRKAFKSTNLSVQEGNKLPI